MPLLPLLALAIAGRAEVSPPAPHGPVPSRQQLAWHRLETYAFVHFNMNTFTGKEWGEGYEDPKQFNPSELDCRQWCRVFKEAGLKAVIITAKHHDGFCLWPSKFTEHSVKNSPFRGGWGDVLRELSDTCREFGLKFGVYLSPWDRNHPDYGNSPVYNRFFMNQLEEVLTSYGPVFEVWFDGANGEGPGGKRQVYDWPAFIGTVRRCQPNAVIFSDGGPEVRWIGNEQGFANETNWCLLRRDEFFPGSPRYRELTSGHEDGTHWVPAECDVSIRPGWFYRETEDAKVKTAGQLEEIYFRSVGRNGALLLNVPADRRGLIHEIDADHLAGFRKRIEATFRKDLARGAKATADEERGRSRRFSAARVVDGNPETYWATEDGSASGELVIELKRPVEANVVCLQEAIALGQRVQQFAVEAWTKGGWTKVAEGTTIGYKRLLRFPAVRASRFRLSVARSKACPTIATFALFFQPEAR